MKEVEMKRILLISGFLVIFLMGCGMEKFSGFITPPNIDSLLVRGWKYYDAGDFSKAEATFDSVISIDVSQLLALVGMGWVKLQTNNYYDAKSFFSLTTTGEEASLIRRVFSEITPSDEILVDTFPYGTNWAISVDYPGILDVKDVSILTFTIEIYEDSITGDTIVDTVITSVTAVSPRYFDNSLIYFKTDSIPDTTDTTLMVVANYVSYEPMTVSDTFEWAYAGIGLANLADEEDGEAAVFLGALLKYDNAFEFPHWPGTRANNLYGALAYAFFRLGLYANCVDVLEEAGWSDPPEDPFVSDAFPAILEQIQELMNE